MAKGLRTPPQTTESEKALLGALLIRADAMVDVVDSISPEALYSEKHRIIYRAMLALWGKNEPVDIETVRARLSDDGQLEQIGGVMRRTGFTGRCGERAAHAGALSTWISSACSWRSAISAPRMR